MTTPAASPTPEFKDTITGASASSINTEHTSSATDPIRPAAGKQAIFKAFEGYKKSFPEVDDITPTELHALQQAEAEFTLVDVRQTDEQQVSMLKGAMRQSDFKSTLSQQDKKRLVVTYCTAGMRSGKYAQELQQQGFRVKNLRGSLVLWAHEGRPMFDSNGAPVKRFHAYGQQWADMAEGSGYQTVVHKFPLLKGAGDIIKSFWPFH